MENITINLFYPCIFLTIIVLIITVGIVIVKCKDSTLVQNIFSKSNDNAKEVTINTTNKMEKMHEDVVKIDFSTSHEKELHTLELMVKELNRKVDILVDKVANLEKKQ